MKHLFRGGRRKVAAVMAVALVASLSQVAPTSASGPVRGGEVTVLVGDPLAEYCPSNNGGNGSLHTFNMVYEPLLQMTQGGKLVPYLAESVTSTDNKVWTIKVRSGITFHSGEPLNAAASWDGVTARASGPRRVRSGSSSTDPRMRGSRT